MSKRQLLRVGYSAQKLIPLESFSEEDSCQWYVGHWRQIGDEHYEGGEEIIVSVLVGSLV